MTQQVTVSMHRNNIIISSNIPLHPLHATRISMHIIILRTCRNSMHIQIFSMARQFSTMLYIKKLIPSKHRTHSLHRYTMTAMMRLLVLFVVMITAHGEDESAARSVSLAPSTSVAPTSSVAPSEPPRTSGAPTGPPTTKPTISPSETGGFQDLDPVCGDCWW